MSLTAFINVRVPATLIPEAANISDAVRDIVAKGLSAGVSIDGYRPVRGEASKPVSFRLSLADDEKIRAIAYAAGIPLSKYVNGLLWAVPKMPAPAPITISVTQTAKAKPKAKPRKRVK
jgi:hypothetical protein